MGIDVYLRWGGMSKEEQKAQYTGFRVDKGDVGYLREAYHGGPYATHILVPEGWADEDDTSPRISAATLRERLPTTVLVALYRNHVVYENGTDGPEDLATALMRSLRETQDRSAMGLRVTPEQETQVKRLIESRDLPDYAMAFVHFVELAEAKEKETGQPCIVHVSA